VLVPLPEVVTDPGVLVTVHVPVDGSPLSTTLPVANPQVGWVIVPTTGAVGVTGWALIIMFAVDAETQPSELVTVYVYVPGASPVIVLVVPLPVEVTDPGVRVSVQVPVAGNPLSGTLPVPDAHVGCTIVPTTGADGVGGCAGISTLADARDVHPEALVTV